jgi:quinoprotein glucose dehydrogenase
MGVKPRGDEGGRRHAGMNAQARTPYAAYTVPFLSPLKAPCQAPPYGELTAIDLKTQTVLWSEPLGTARDNGPLDIASHLPIPMGTPNTGGSITTGSGLIFISATFEQTFRAIDAATGKILWQDRLPAGGQASPMSYRSPASGRQFVVIAAGGHSILQSKAGDYVIAYALPK